MGDGSQTSCDPQLIFPQDPPKEDGNANGADAACGRVKNGAEVAGKDGTQKDPGSQNQSAFSGAKDKYREHCDNICKTPLHTRQGYKGRDLGFHHENGEGDSSQQSQKGDFLNFYSRHLLSTI